MNVLQNLIAFYNHLSSDSTYRSTAGKILENLSEAANLTICELSELTNSSRTTIYRMLQKMGYTNYLDFHHALKQAINNFTYYNRMIPSSEILDSSDITSYCCTQVNELSMHLKNLLPLESLERTASDIMDSASVYFFLSHQSAAVNSFQQNLAMAGKANGLYCLYPDQLGAAQSLPQGSIVFINTIEFAESQDMTLLFKELKKRKTKIILLSTVESRYEKYADSYFVPVENSLSVLSSLLLIEIYFFMLSEILRYNYIDNDS